MGRGPTEYVSGSDTRQHASSGDIHDTILQLSEASIPQHQRLRASGSAQRSQPRAVEYDVSVQAIKVQ